MTSATWKIPTTIPTPTPRKFVAIDGEGYTRDDGIHVYNLIAASDGSHISTAHPLGLTTQECWDYLLDLKIRNPNSVFVSFYFSYDVNMILGNIGFVLRETLAKYGHVRAHVKGSDWVYKNDYLPKKMYSLSRGKQIEIGGRKKFKSINRIVVYDVWGFFQSSFVNALRQFNISDEETIKEIEDMKGQRADFDPTRLDDVIKYCLSECELLAQLMETVDDRMQFAGIHLQHWHGAGAVAGTLLRKHSIHKHIARPIAWTHDNAVRSAYFGGRIQALKVGILGPSIQYDIVSAYPSVMQHLPTLRGMTERETAEFIPDYPYAVYRVTWDLPEDTLVTPFPFRTPDGGIEYPLSGEGYYWYEEVAAALEFYGEYVNIERGYVFENIDAESRPFWFIPDMFEQRKLLKTQGNMAQLCIKLGLNSLYGKTAQGSVRKNELPPFQCYMYAGMTTAGTRAKMFRAAMQNPDTVIAFCTDGLIVGQELDLECANTLGSWEREDYVSTFVLKPGFYELMPANPKKKPVRKVRGFMSKSVDYEKIRAEFERTGVNGSVKFMTRQFIGLKSASINRKWRTWEDVPRQLNFWPGKGEPANISVSPLQFRILPPVSMPGISAPYSKSKCKEYDPRNSPEMEHIEGWD